MANTTLYHIIMECQLLHRIDIEIIETLEKLKTIDTTKRKVSILRRDILDSIPHVDCRTEQMLQEYRQMGLLFIYNIDETPKCYMNCSLSSLVVILKSMAVSMLTAFSSGRLLKGSSLKLKDILDVANNIGSLSDSLTWMLTCVSKAIITGIHSIDSVRDVSSLVPIEPSEPDLISKLTAGTSQFEQYANSQAAFALKLIASKMREMSISLSSREDVRFKYVIKVAMGVLRKHIRGRINERIASGEKLRRSWCYLYGNVTSKSRFDAQQFENWVCDLVQLSVHSFTTIRFSYSQH